MVFLVFTTYYIKTHGDTVPSFQIKAPIKAYSNACDLYSIALNDVIAPTILRQISGFEKDRLKAFISLELLEIVYLLLQTRFSINICTMLNLHLHLTLGL